MEKNKSYSAPLVSRINIGIDPRIGPNVDLVRYNSGINSNRTISPIQPSDSTFSAVWTLFALWTLVAIWNSLIIPVKDKQNVLILELSFTLIITYLGWVIWVIFHEHVITDFGSFSEMLITGLSLLFSLYLMVSNLGYRFFSKIFKVDPKFCSKPELIFIAYTYFDLCFAINFLASLYCSTSYALRVSSPDHGNDFSNQFLISAIIYFYIGFIFLPKEVFRLRSVSRIPLQTSKLSSLPMFSYLPISTVLLSLSFGSIAFHPLSDGAYLPSTGPVICFAVLSSLAVLSLFVLNSLFGRFTRYFDSSFMFSWFLIIASVLTFVTFLLEMSTGYKVLSCSWPLISLISPAQSTVIRISNSVKQRLKKSLD